MPPRLNSRHEFTSAIEANGVRVLTRRVPFRFQDLNDNVQHLVSAGESLFTIAGRYFKGVTERPSGLWWIIADFQPNPIHDPTLELEEGTVLFVPSERTVREEIFNPKRRELF